MLLIIGILMPPGHPLMLAISVLILEQPANLLRQGAILVDSADEGEQGPCGAVRRPRWPEK
jgi:hypothetical protein